MGVWSRRTPRPSSSIRALVFLVLGEVTPSWSSFTSGSADFRLAADPPSLCPELVLGLEMELGLELEESWSDGIFSLGLGADDDDDSEEEDDDDDEGLGVREELGLPVDSLEMEPGMIPEPRLGLEPPWWSEEGFVLGVEAEEGLGVEEPLGLGAADVARGLEMGLLVVGLTPLLLLLLSLSLRWLLYELRLGSLYRSTVRTFP